MRNFDAKLCGKRGGSLMGTNPYEEREKGKNGSQSATDTVFDSPGY